MDFGNFFMREDLCNMFARLKQDNIFFVINTEC